MGRVPIIFLLLSSFMLAAFKPISDWKEVEVTPAFDAMRQSCRGNYKQPHCQIFLKRSEHSEKEKRAYFEEFFELKALSQEGLLTGYYLPLLEGSLKPSSEYPYPVWGKPADFKSPYPFDRKAIDRGALDDKEKPLLWVKSKIDLFFLQIQGSGRVQLTDGEIVGLGFTAKTGHPYHAIGRTLIEEDALTKENVSLQSIKRWLRENPEQRDRILWTNPSYVFFQLQTEPEAIGAQGVPLTPRGSVAIDPEYTLYGTPLLIETTLPNKEGAVTLLTIAQDTGSAIKSPNRADWFLGFGAEAEQLAGQLKSAARFYQLIPQKR
jgi:membrane-bound lytic murein transglycosylase A